MSLLRPFSVWSPRNGTEPVSRLSRYVHRGGTTRKKKREMESLGVSWRMNEPSGRRKRERDTEGRRGERSQFSNGPGESGGYTFTDLHYPRFAPTQATVSAADTHRSVPAAWQRTNCPVTHRPHVHVINVTHKMTPGLSSPRRTVSRDI